jgi:hypothetical protein
VLKELCYQYSYDEKGRTVFKRAPGAKELLMLYDSRDRVVFLQDGNQRAKSTPEWTVNLYDELDRLTVTALYKSSKTAQQLKTDIAAAQTSTTTIVQAAQPITDLVVSLRDPGTGRYAARNSISFVADGSGNFTTGPGDEFTAEIDGSATRPPLSVTTTGAAQPHQYSRTQ